MDFYRFMAFYLLFVSESHSVCTFARLLLILVLFIPCRQLKLADKGYVKFVESTYICIRAVPITQWISSWSV